MFLNTLLPVFYIAQNVNINIREHLAHQIIELRNEKDGINVLVWEITILNVVIQR